MNKKNKLVITFISIVLLVIFILLPIEYPISISAKAKIVPNKTWILLKGPDGRLITSLVDNFTGINKEFSVTQFERGDAVKFALEKNIIPGQSISVDDTIGVVYSNKNEQEIEELKGELAVAKASLSVKQSSEKQSVIDEEKRKLAYAQKQVEEQSKIFERQKKLYEKQLISQQDYENEQAKLDLYRINVNIAEEKLRTVQSGAKAEEIQFINSQIKSLENEISLLEQKSNSYVLRSPISGNVASSYNQDTLLIVNSDKEYAAFIPINLSLIHYVTKGNQIEIIQRNDSTLLTKVDVIDETVRTFAKEQFVMVKSIFKRTTSNFFVNEFVDCKVQCNKSNLWEYLKYNLIK